MKAEEGPRRAACNEKEETRQGGRTGKKRRERDDGDAGEREHREQ